MLMWISEVIILTDMMFISVNICEYIWQIPVNIMDQCLFKYLGQILTGVFTGVNICFWNSQIFTWAYLWISSKKYEQILTCRTADAADRRVGPCRPGPARRPTIWRCLKDNVRAQVSFENLVAILLDIEILEFSHNNYDIVLGYR